MDAACSMPSKHNSGQQLPDELPADLPCAPLVWVHRGGSFRPCSGPTTAPTQFCAAGHTSSPSGLRTRTRSSPPAVSSPERMTLKSQASYAARADCLAPVRGPCWPSITTAVRPPQSGSHLQTHWCPRLPCKTRSSIRMGKVLFHPMGVFVCPGMTSPSQPLQKQYLQRQ
jgi:hypothetical protein